jgi:hypothetical protein
LDTANATEEDVGILMAGGKIENKSAQLAKKGGK